MAEQGQEIDPYVFFCQCNLWRSPNAASKLGLYLNKVMAHFKYFNSDSAGFFANDRPEPDENYRKRLRNVGIITNEEGEVTRKPTPEERKSRGLMILNPQTGAI